MIDDRIKLLAKKIADERPPAILIRNWINELIEIYKKENNIYLYERKDGIDAPLIIVHRYYGIPETWIMSEGAKRELEFLESKIKNIYEIAKDNNCDKCRQIAEYTEPILLA